MITLDKLNKQITHYQEEVSELYSLLKVLQNPIFLRRFNSDKKDLSELLNNIKYLLFFLSCFLDILVSSKALFLIELHWERKYHIKNGMVAIYESITAFNKQQKKIREYLTRQNSPLIENLTSISIKVRDFKKEIKFDSELANFRNKAGAHYDSNIEIYLSNLESVDKPQSVISIKKFGDILNEILSLWSEVNDELYEKIKKSQGNK